MFSLFSNCSCANTNSDISATLNINSVEIGSVDSQPRSETRVNVKVELTFSLNCTIASSRDALATFDAEDNLSKGKIITHDYLESKLIPIPLESIQAYSGEFDAKLLLKPKQYIFAYLREQNPGKFRILGISQTLRIEISKNMTPTPRENIAEEDLEGKKLEEELESRLASSNFARPLDHDPLQNGERMDRSLKRRDFSWAEEEIAEEFQKFSPISKRKKDKIFGFSDNFNPKIEENNENFSNFPSTPGILRKSRTMNKKGKENSNSHKIFFS